jgi:Ras family protein A
LWDTAGQEDYDRLRPLSYPDTDVILLCFAVDNPDSFQNVQEKWIPEINHFCNSVPVLLVGTKSDLRYSDEVLKRLGERQLKPIAPEQGISMSSKIGAHAYLECSAKSREGVQKVFEMAAKLSFKRLRFKRNNKGCKIL